MPDMSLSRTFAGTLSNFESGVGIAVRNAEGKFFCGFEQEDGSIAFSVYRQAHGSPLDRWRAPPVKETGAPVFLSPDEMQAQGIGAAVYFTAFRPLISSDIPVDGCKAIVVRKDMSMHLQPRHDGPRMGIASAAACNEGTSDGYILLKDDVKSAVRAVKNFLKKTF